MVRDRERWEIYPPIRLGFEDVAAFDLVVGSDNPTFYKNVMHNKELSRWMTAMMEELESLNKKLDLGFGGATKWKKGDRLKMSVLKKEATFEKN